MKKQNFIRKIVAFLCITAVLVTTLLAGGTVEAATKVSASEKAKVKKTIGQIEDYLCYCNYCDWNSKTFKFDNTRKTDMAIHTLPYDKINSEYKNTDRLMEKYGFYAGGYKYSKKAKSLIKQRGKQMFGNSYQLSFVTERKSGQKPYLYPLTYDKKYIKMNAYDWGDYCQSLAYKSISKISGGYLVKLKVTETLEEKSTGKSKTFTVKLKKQGKSLIINDIKMK
mgnify:FL=1